MRVLGIEGTAWAASAAVYDTRAPDGDAIEMRTETYTPETGGIHPREAAEHMRTAIPDVIDAVLTATDGDIDAVAFSRGPGLGPCLRIVGTASRALAGRLDVPLVGVNHMIAHLEIGRHRSGFEDPVCLNASGANAHVLGHRDGRYRVLGETMDTGVGNALDKFTRHLGWSHPGGPKVEARAADGAYLDLPYVVKGMDFSFSGIVSAAKATYDDGAPVEDVCFSLQENVFAMLTEVSERALSLTGASELVLGGGVGQNDRLRSMLATMCDSRGAEFFAPPPRFLRDNAGMIAVLGAAMHAADDHLPVEASTVRPRFRPDEVPVTWRSPDSTGRSGSPDAGDPGTEPGSGETEIQGAEALVTIGDRVTKVRQRRGYRHRTLDDRLRRSRTASEARLTSDARRVGVPTPVVHDVDPHEGRLVLEHVGDCDLREALTESAVGAVGHHLASMHRAGMVHGDPTPRNVRVSRPSSDADDGAQATTVSPTHLIDFGLGFYTDDVEDHAMDLHVFEQALSGTADGAEELRETFEEAYRDAGDEEVLVRLRGIEGRGRYQTADPRTTQDGNDQ